MSVLNHSTLLGFLKNNDYFREVLTYSFNKELVLHSTFPILESWFICLLLHNPVTSCGKYSSCLPGKVILVKCVFLAAFWCDIAAGNKEERQYKVIWQHCQSQLGNHGFGLATKLWRIHSYRPECARCAWHFSSPDAMASLLGLRSSILRILFWTVDKCC